MTNTERGATAAALTGTLGLAAACWAVLIHRMGAMEMPMDAAAPVAQMASFMGMWALMMAAMMLPGIAPAALNNARAGADAPAVLGFAGSYLLVWALAGIPVYALHRPHGVLVAGLVTVAAGLYELTPLKKAARRRCCAPMRNGFECGLYCIGSSIGLMLAQLALGAMSLAWMAVVTAVVTAQKILPARPVADTVLALAIIGLGLLVLAMPDALGALAPRM